MIQTLNLILITSPELSDLRKRLKTVETRVRGGKRILDDYGSYILIAGWTSVIHFFVSLMVSQRRGSLFTLFAGSSV
jgi:hypothetical protein